MTHRTTAEFWAGYHALPNNVQQVADRAFALLRSDLRHSSLHLKRVRGFWSVRVGIHYRALGVERSYGILWFWIGTHAEYDRLTG